MGLIAIDRTHSWVVARWAVHFVLDQVDLSSVSEILAKQIVEATEIHSGYLTLERLPPEDVAQFGIQVRRIADDLVEAGPNSISTPGTHESLVKSIRRLQHLVEGQSTS